MRVRFDLQSVKGESCPHRLAGTKDHVPDHGGRISKHVTHDELFKICKFLHFVHGNHC